jgi:hypothetical protein
MRSGMRSAWRDLVRVESTEANHLRNDRGRLTPVIGLLENVAAKIHTLRIFGASFLTHFR